VVEKAGYGTTPVQQTGKAEELRRAEDKKMLRD